ncbi:hypothetical protein V5O48_014663 [Marasmius crinis-equi]|uniref:PPPDE domain-containing protein n=1 Tax=Marasmius crinis-equi TaxID=585013 RepID=A0ABR3EWN6_9AGAR
MAIFRQILSYLLYALAKMSRLTTSAYRPSPFRDDQHFIYTVNQVAGYNQHASFPLKNLECDLKIIDDDCKVRLIALCKRPQGVQHESIAALISFPPSSGAPDAPRLERPIIIERGIPRDPNSSTYSALSLDAVVASSTSSSTSLSRPRVTPELVSKSRMAADTVTVIHTTCTRWDLQSLVRAAAESQVDPAPDPSTTNQSESTTPPISSQHSDTYVLQYEEGQGPTLVDLVAIASMVSENWPNYGALKENCYYFAAMVFGVVGKVFTANRVKNVEPTHAEVYRGLTFPVGPYGLGSPSPTRSGKYHGPINLRTLNPGNTDFQKQAQKLIGQFPNKRKERLSELRERAPRADTIGQEARRLAAENKRLEEENAAQDSKNKRLKEDNEAKDLRIKELERRVDARSRSSQKYQ